MKKKANYDALTGIFNRNRLNQQLNEELKTRNTLSASIPLSLIMFDIDHFKKINDTYGHTVGDEVLKKLPETVKIDIRKGDLFVRWGGEEFIIVLANTELLEAQKVADHVRKAIEKELFHEKIDQVTCSFGVTDYHKGDSIDSIINRADAALYKAKNSGRNRIVAV